MAEPVAARPFLGIFGLILLAIAALFAIDMLLARSERTESAAEAARVFQQGTALMQQSRNGEAIEKFQDAIAIERGNRDYRRSLAQAQFAAGKAADAESTLTELLQQDSTDGPASLIMGRALARQGRFAEAISYFHRAIYGQWTTDAAGNRLRTRFELIDLLAGSDSREELLAELLPVEERAPGDLQTRVRIGRLFLRAGAPARAADEFRGALQDAPDSADARSGLGEAEFAQGNYRAAQRDFAAALRLEHGDATARERLDLCNELLALDPTLRGLGPVERSHRSLALLQLTRDETSQCAGPNPSPELKELLDRAAGELKARVSAAREDEVYETNLTLSEQLWKSRRSQCRSPVVSQSPLALVQAKLAE